MKKASELLALSFLIAFMATLYGCKKDLEPDIPDQTKRPSLTTAVVSGITINSAKSGGNVTSDGGSEITLRGVCWSMFGPPTFYDIKTEDGADTGSFTSNLFNLNPGTTYFVRAYAVNNAGVAYGDQTSFTTLDPPGTGTKKADFPGGARYYATGFGIGNKVYMGLGYNDGDWNVGDIWEWDQATNIWTKKKDFPGSTWGDFVGFSIGTKGYIGTGNYIDVNSSSYDFWEYDPETNGWTQKASLPVTPARAKAVGFSIGTKGYIGIGGKWGLTSDPYYRDFWEWDQETNVWTKKADFPGNTLIAAVGFSIGNKGYIGTGSDGTSYSTDFWEWDQETDVWTQKSDFKGNARSSAVGFSIGNKGYIGTGSKGNNAILLRDFWEWDQETDVWTQKPDFKGNARSSAVGFSIGNKGYIGTGFGGNFIYVLQDFWEYDPSLK